MGSLKDIILSQNNLHYIPYGMIYGRRYRKIDLTGNPRLFNPRSIDKIRSDVNRLEHMVADLKFIALANAFNYRYDMTKFYLFTDNSYLVIVRELFCRRSCVWIVKFSCIVALCVSNTFLSTVTTTSNLDSVTFAVALWMFSMFDRRLWRIIVLTFVSIASRKPLV
jgi:hypothetical protein